MQTDTGVAHRPDAAFEAPQAFLGALTQPPLKRANRRDATTSVRPGASTGGRKRREQWDEEPVRGCGRGAPPLAPNATDAKETGTVRPCPAQEQVCLRNLG